MVPLAAVRATRTVVASGSATEKVSVLATSSVPVWVPGTVLTGGSLTAVIVMVRLRVLELAVPSLTRTVMARVVPGLLLVGFWNPTDRSAVW